MCCKPKNSFTLASELIIVVVTYLNIHIPTSNNTFLLYYSLLKFPILLIVSYYLILLAYLQLLKARVRKKNCSSIIMCCMVKIARIERVTSCISGPRGGCARVIECNRSSSAHHRVCTFFPSPFNPVGKGSGHAQTTRDRYGERQSPDGNKRPRGKTKQCLFMK